MKLSFALSWSLPILSALAVAPAETPDTQTKPTTFGRMWSGMESGSSIVANQARENFSLARGARIYPIKPNDARLSPDRKVTLPPALRPKNRAGRKEPFVFLAVSGGGSRAAYYAACVMENLAKVPVNDSSGESILDKVRAISSVSGGGLAAGYYVAKFSERKAPDFFDRFRGAMAVNLQWSTYGGMVLFPPLALQLVGTTVNRTDLLAKQMENLLDEGPLTFKDLERRENDTSDPAPVLLVNGTAYNSGQRFVMTNLKTEFLPTIFPDRGRPLTNKSVESGFIRKLLEPITPEQMGMDIRSLRVATALSASAAFPVLLAPVRLKVYPDSVPVKLRERGVPDLLESEYLHVADGGLHDNFGTDTLLSLIRALPPDQPVMIIVIDATLRSETLKLNRQKIWWPWTSVLRMYDIGSLRGLGLAGALLHEVRPRGNYGAVVIKMAATDPRRQSIINKIPTSFSITMANRINLEDTAAANVQQVAAGIQREYARLKAGRAHNGKWGPIGQDIGLLSESKATQNQERQ